MSNVIIGTLERIVEKEGQFGPMINYVVNGDYYFLKGRKFKERGIKEGDLVKIEFDVNAKGYKDIVRGGIEVTEGAAEPASAGAKPAGATGVPYKDPRQTIISKQAAFNTALAFVGHAIAADCVPFTLKSKADNLALFTNWVNAEAIRFYGLSTGEEWEMEEQAPAKPAIKKAAKKKVVEEEDDGSDDYPDEYEE